MVFDLFLLDAVGNFGVKAIAGANQGDYRVGVEEVKNATGGDLGCKSMSTIDRCVQLCVHGLTSPPPTTSTFLLRTCQARIRDPPPSISGNFSPIVLFVIP